MCNRHLHYFCEHGRILICLLLFSCLPLAEAQNATESGSVVQQPAPGSDIALDHLLAHYPAGSIHTMEDASRAGEDVHKMHALIETQFSNEQKLCYPKFFATSCLIDAKERHRVALAKVRAIEIEVNQFKRRANVITRDKALAAKHEQEAAELAVHEKESLSPTPDHVPALAHAIKPKSVTNSRLAKHQSEVKKREAAETENAKQRASNIAAYEKKQQESEARQREIAAKKLEKARAQSSKETAASK